MAEFLIILLPSITPVEREAIMGVVTPTQSVSNRVFLATLNPTALSHLRSLAGIAIVLTGKEPTSSLPPLDDAELLFVQAWLSRHGQVKQRFGEGLDWDTPPMMPPDPPR